MDIKTTIQYLDEAKRKLGIDSDYEMAKWLGMTPGAAYHYRHGRRVIDDYTAAKIAEVLELDPLEVIAAANAEREKDEGKREYWKKIFHTATAAALAFSFGFQELKVLENFNNSDSVYYVKSNDRRRRSGWKWLCYQVLGINRRKDPWTTSTNSAAVRVMRTLHNVPNFWVSRDKPSLSGTRPGPQSRFIN